MAPRDERRQRAMSRWSVARAVDEQLEALLEIREECAEAERRNTPRGELERERQPIEPATDLGESLGLARDLATRALEAIDEQRHGLAREHFGARRAGLGQRQRRHAYHELCARAE